MGTTTFDLAKNPISSLSQVHPNLQKIQACLNIHMPHKPASEYRKHPTLRSSYKRILHSRQPLTIRTFFVSKKPINKRVLYTSIQHPTHLYKRGDPCKAVSYIIYTYLFTNRSAATPAHSRRRLKQGGREDGATHAWQGLGFRV